MFDRHHVVRGVLFMEFAFPNHAAKLKEPEATAAAGGLLVVRDAAAVYEQAVKSWLENHAATSSRAWGMSFV
jgi:hypothetical protein